MAKIKKCLTNICVTLLPDGSKKLYCDPCIKQRRRISNSLYQKLAHANKGAPVEAPKQKLNLTNNVTDEEQIEINKAYVRNYEGPRENISLTKENAMKIGIMPQTQAILWMFR
jgi:hypothetical protein